MAMAADSIRHLTRAYIGARVFLGLLFWWALMHNIYAVMKIIGDPNPRLRLWLDLGAVVTAATLGTYYQWRFGRVEPPRPSLWDRPFQEFRYGVVGPTALGLLLLAALVLGAEAGARPRDLLWVMISGATAMSLAASRGDQRARLMAGAVAAMLFATLVAPALRPFQVVGHLAMAAVLVATAVQLHLFLVREFRHAHV